jgi:hypothetical protein
LYVHTESLYDPLLRSGSLLLLASQAGNAQALYGSLTGNVTDPSGAAIPGATVEARNVGTGVTRNTTTDVRGVYLFNDLSLGN